MQKKTLNMEEIEKLDFSNEEYLEFIREAGFDPDQLYKDFGQFVESINNDELQNEANDFRKFYEWLENKLNEDFCFGYEREQLSEVFQKVKSAGGILVSDITADRRVAKIYEEFKRRKEPLVNH